MIEKIRLYGDEVLRKVSKPALQIDDNIRTKARNLTEYLELYDEFALSGPQMGYSIRMFSIRPIWIEDIKKRKPMIFINPTLLEFSGVQNESEGCLSIPEIFERVKRAQKVVFKAQNLFGKWKQYTATDLFSRAVQHEYDHLEGILFIDKISPLKRKLLQGKLRKIASTTKDGVNIG